MGMILEKIFGKSWRTAVAGWATGLPTILLTLADAYQQGSLSGKHGIGMIVGIALIIQGSVAKDAKVTGLPSDNKTP